MSDYTFINLDNNQTYNVKFEYVQNIINTENITNIKFIRKDPNSLIPDRFLSGRRKSRNY